MAAAFLGAHWEELELSRIASPDRLSWYLLTPSFPASSHVVFIVLSGSSSEPVLVMKISRIPGEDPALFREAVNLRAVHAATGNVHSSIPRVIVLGRYHETSILIETALVGVPVDPAFVRRSMNWSVDTTLQWIATLNEQTIVMSYERPGWCATLIDSSLERIESAVRLSAEEKEQLAKVRELTSVLRNAAFPLVFSHGDLSDPNILALRKGGIGVVDWEMAEPEGLPASDLFFFLNYVATVRTPWARVDDLRGFRNAFFRENSWTREYIARYSQQFRLDKQLLKPLFVLCFTRYLSGLIGRLQGPSGSLDAETSAFLRTDRAYVLWREAVRNFDGLALA